jgi:hypothetical protein
MFLFIVPEGDSLMKAKTLLDDASGSPKHLNFENSGSSVVYISSQEMEVDHFVENVLIGDVASAPLSSSVNAESHSDTIKPAAKGCCPLFEFCYFLNLCIIDFTFCFLHER